MFTEPKSVDPLPKVWDENTRVGDMLKGQRLVDIAEIGRVVAFLCGGASSSMTGDVIYVDAELHIIA